MTAKPVFKNMLRSKILPNLPIMVDNTTATIFLKFPVKNVQNNYPLVRTDYGDISQDTFNLNCNVTLVSETIFASY